MIRWSDRFSSLYRSVRRADKEKPCVRQRSDSPAPVRSFVSWRPRHEYRERPILTVAMRLRQECRVGSIWRSRSNDTCGGGSTMNLLYHIARFAEMTTGNRRNLRDRLAATQSGAIWPRAPRCVAAKRLGGDPNKNRGPTTTSAVGASASVEDAIRDLLRGPRTMNDGYRGCRRILR